MKASLLFVFLAVAGAWYTSSDASAQKSRAVKPPKFSKFTHQSHAGQVKSLIAKNQVVELNCAYCHGTAAKDKLGKDQHDLEAIGYPSHKDGATEAKTHSSCTECHSFSGATMAREMCAICHDKLTLDPKVMATNIRRFPNPEGGVSQFYDAFSHSSHVDYYDQYATSTPLKERVKFFDAKAADPKVNKGLDKSRFECAACHTANTAPVNVAKINFAPGVKMSAPSHPDCFVCHFDPKIVSPPKGDKPSPKNTFATNCIGCHADTAKPTKADRPVAGSELAVHWFARQIVNTELNPAKQGVKSPLPFSHKTHEDAVGKSVTDCLSCHVTAKNAKTMADFYLVDSKTQEKQPSALSCYACHDRIDVPDPATGKKQKVDLMKQKIEGTVTLATSRCNYCHALETIKAFGAKGVAMPPPSHFGKKAIQPTPTPLPKQ